jgi:hypothetical protein
LSFANFGQIKEADADETASNIKKAKSGIVSL